MASNTNSLFTRIFKELSSSWNYTDNVISSRCGCDSRHVEFIRYALQYDKIGISEIYKMIISGNPSIIDLFHPIHIGYEIFALAHPSGLLYSTITKGIMLGAFDKNGYMVAQCRYTDADGTMKNRSYRWHRLIAFAFINNPDPSHMNEINHIDGHKRNNCVANLEWCTTKENCEHKIRIGLQKVGEDSYQALYSNDQIRHVCELLQQGIYSPMYIEKETGVGHKAVCRIKAGRIWKSISKEYSFPNYTYDSFGRWIDDAGNVHGEKIRENPDRHIYSEKQIRLACEMKCKRHKIADIVEATGVGKRTIVKLGGSEDTYSHITKDYVFPTIARKDGSIRKDIRWYTDDEIKHVCDLMMNPELSVDDVSAKTGISRRTIRRFHTDTDPYPHITKHYIFPAYRMSKRGYIDTVYR